MMQDIAMELDDVTQAFSFDRKMIQILDLCMAPGGFSAYTIRKNPMSTVDAFSLPEAEGGHPVLLSFGKRNTRVQVHFTDITMWAKELGVDDIPESHPEVSKFQSGWPYSCKSYDLVICDGQALRTHEVAEYRRHGEQTRLTNTQLVLGLQRIRPGGTLIMLLHKAYKWRCLKLLKTFNRFSDIQIFKPSRYHAEKSSFYLIAKHVQPEKEEAIEAVNTFRNSWRAATFGTDQGDEENDELVDEDMVSVLDEFGPQFVELTRPVWAVQAAALREAMWMRGAAEQT